MIRDLMVFAGRCFLVFLALLRQKKRQLQMFGRFIIISKVSK